MTDQPSAEEVIAAAPCIQGDDGGTQWWDCQQTPHSRHPECAIAALRDAGRLRTPGTCEVAGTGLDESKVWEMATVGRFDAAQVLRPRKPHDSLYPDDEVDS